MKPHSQYNLLRPYLVAYEAAVAKGNEIDWLANCYIIEGKQKRFSLRLPCGKVSRIFFIALMGMHKKFSLRNLRAARELALQRFNQDLTKKRKRISDQHKRSKLTPTQRLLGDSTGFVKKNPDIKKSVTSAKTRSGSSKRSRRSSSSSSSRAIDDNKTDDEKYGKIRLAKTTVWILNVGTSMNKLSKENRPYIIWKGKVLESGRPQCSDLKVSWHPNASKNKNLSLKRTEKNEIEAITLFQGGASNPGSFVHSTLKQAKQACQLTERAVLVFTGGRESEGGLKDSICTPTAKTIEIPTSLNITSNQIQVSEDFKISDTINDTMSMVELTKTPALSTILDVLGCRMFRLSPTDVNELKVLWDECVTDTSWSEKYPDTKVERHSFSLLAGKLFDLDNLQLRHRYSWGKLTEKDCCSFKPHEKIKKLARFLSVKFKNEMKDLKFNAGQLLNYAADISAKIPWHRDGSAHKGGVDGNSQVGGTGVTSVTLVGSGVMLFGREGVNNQGAKTIDEIASVHFDEGIVFFMSALVDRILYHSTAVGENGRLALILRCLNQPRLFTTGENAQIVI